MACTTRLAVTPSRRVSAAHRRREPGERSGAATSFQRSPGMRRARSATAAPIAVSGVSPSPRPTGAVVGSHTSGRSARSSASRRASAVVGPQPTTVPERARPTGSWGSEPGRGSSTGPNTRSHRWVTVSRRAGTSGGSAASHAGIGPVTSGFSRGRTENTRGSLTSSSVVTMNSASSAGAEPSASLATWATRASASWAQTRVWTSRVAASSGVVPFAVSFREANHLRSGSIRSGPAGRSRGPDSHRPPPEAIRCSTGSPSAGSHRVVNRRGLSGAPSESTRTVPTPALSRARAASAARSGWNERTRTVPSRNAASAACGRRVSDSRCG